MNICIITNSYHRSKELVSRSLKSSLKHSEHILKLFFIDQNEIPLELDSEIKDHPKIEIIQKNVTCVSQARNLVSIPDNTDWLIFCDDDGYIDENYISKLKEFVSQNADVQVIAGSIVRDDNGEYYSPRHKIGGDLNQFRNTKLLMGSNFSVKKEVFQKLSKFDEDFGAGGYWGAGEETDFAWNAHFSGINLAYHRELIVYHVPPYAGTLNHSIKKAYRYGIGKGALVMKWLLKGKFKVLYELVEMYAVPFIQIFLSLIKLKWNMIPVYFSTLIGRTMGLLKGLKFYLV